MLARSNKRHLVRNAILAGLSAQEMAAISPFLEPIVMKDRLILHESNKSVDRVYFIETGVVSLRMVAAGSILETAVVGYQGAVGASSVLGAHMPISQSVVLFPGSALRIDVDDLRRVADERPQIRERLARYVRALAVHSAQTGFCGVRHSLEQRLASWLCLTGDAFDRRTLPITHDYLSAVLGLRRAGVTEALIRFEEDGLIHKMRGVLQVNDRKRLEQKTCGCYGTITNAYASATRFPSAAQQAEIIS
jgi:CRP-like cAMP-binding protein